jgi:hypothetical protein
VVVKALGELWDFSRGFLNDTFGEGASKHHLPDEHVGIGFQLDNTVWEGALKRRQVISAHLTAPEEPKCPQVDKAPQVSQSYGRHLATSPPPQFQFPETGQLSEMSQPGIRQLIATAEGE